MIIGKEQLIYFEKLASKQKRLYVDACDFGIYLNPKTKNEARENIIALMKEYNVKVVKSKDGKWSTTEVYFPVEQSEHNPKFVNCIKMHICYSNDDCFGEIMSIDFDRVDMPENIKFFRS